MEAERVMAKYAHLSDPTSSDGFLDALAHLTGGNRLKGDGIIYYDPCSYSRTVDGQFYSLKYVRGAESGTSVDLLGRFVLHFPLREVAENTEGDVEDVKFTVFSCSEGRCLFGLTVKTREEGGAGCLDGCHSVSAFSDDVFFVADYDVRLGVKKCRRVRGCVYHAKVECEGDRCGPGLARDFADYIRAETGSVSEELLASRVQEDMERLIASSGASSCRIKHIDVDASRREYFLDVRGASVVDIYGDYTVEVSCRGGDYVKLVKAFSSSEP